jgi:hypothetical protein
MTVVAGKRRRRASDAEVQRLNVFIDPDAHKRLMVHSVYEGLSPGLFVERLINEHCKTWKVQTNAPRKGKKGDQVDSGAPDGDIDRPDPVNEASDSDAEAA